MAALSTPVSTYPGPTALTRTPCGAHSTAAEREPHDGGLGRGDTGPARRASLRRDGRDIHDDAAVSFDHDPAGGLEAVEDTVEVHVHDGRPVLPGEVDEWAVP